MGWSLIPHYTSWRYVYEEGPQTTTKSSTTSKTTSTTTTIDYFEFFETPRPTCMNAMPELCLPLYQAIQVCHNVSSSLTSCYCDSLASNNCTGLCLDGHEPNDYLSYIIPICEELSSTSASYVSQAPRPSNSLSHWTDTWPDYQPLSAAAYAQLFPWNWNVRFDESELTQQPDVDRAKCPTPNATLLSLGVINIVVFIASLASANRHVVYALTFRKFGGDKGGKWWPASALLAVAINVVGNTINAFLVTSRAGYHHVPFGSLVLFWCTRPRLAWLVIVMVWATKVLQWDMTVYVEAAVSAIMAEVILQAIAAVYLGMTVNHARANQFYLLRHLNETPHGRDAHIMYAGALLWIVGVGLAFLFALLAFSPVIRIVEEACLAIIRFSKLVPGLLRKRIKDGPEYVLCTMQQFWDWLKQKLNSCIQSRTEADSQERNEKQVKKRKKVIFDEYVKQMGFNESIMEQLWMLLAFLIIPWLGQWIFWIGFLRMAQDLYCPPSIWSLTAVWSSTSVVAVWVGTGP
ncbi:hypothetical protein H2198_007471 [Neophaeococcomyces mojaviensis]|uniref:Uncharacterized protein n=1 Tax=Neophaeococcomyces mojaviensis TaxID=3383035 RepID=A0ACC2ZZW0_9EURO|nr:hypothetical protein H2198_007471 [Knufia sp. JES_112]